MARAFKLPDLGEGLTEGEVARWLVVEGQEVHEDDPLVEISTDKATVEIPSPYEGTVLRILVAEGEIAPVGAELVIIGEPGESIPVGTQRLKEPSNNVLQGAGRTVAGFARAAEGQGCRRLRSFGASRRARCRPSRRSREPGRAVGSPRTTCGPSRRVRAEKKADARSSAASAAWLPSTWRACSARFRR